MISSLGFGACMLTHRLKAAPSDQQCLSIFGLHSRLTYRLIFWIFPFSSESFTVSVSS